jgi:hypothetical protein
MSVRTQINEFIASHDEPKRTDLQALNDLILRLNPKCKLWFLDGKNADGKLVSNPDIGYGSRPHKYADGTISEFYQIGLSPNKSGISVYILGLDDRKILPEKYGKDMGKATVTGYCIKFKSLKDINTDVLAEAIRFGFEQNQDTR